MRISDWSSDVCSSDLLTAGRDQYLGASFGHDMRDALSNARSRTGDDSDLTCKRLHALELISFNLLGVNSRGLPAAVISMEPTKRWLVLQSRESDEIGRGGEEPFPQRQSILAPFEIGRAPGRVRVVKYR